MTAILRATAAILLLAFPAVRADKPLKVEARAERLVETVDAGGGRKAVLVPATDVKPGDEIIFTVRFTNTTDQPLERATISASIPAGMRYVGGSATGPGTDVSFSIDGGSVFRPADGLRAGSAGGRQADLADYTDIRWVMHHPLGPGATGFAHFRAVAAEPAAAKPDAESPGNG